MQSVMIIKLVFFELFDDNDFIALKEITNKSYIECLKFTEELMQDIEQKRKRKIKYESLLSRLYLLICYIQKKC